jgi:hypothetical protein
MCDSFWRKVLLAALIVPVLGLVVVNSPLSVGQDKGAKKAESADAAAEKPKGRLPQYYADVVSEEQRTKIYAIQAKFADQIKDLNEQLAAVAKKQNDEIDAVLTAEQKAKVDEARKEAVAKKKKKSDDKKKSTTKTEAKSN